MEKIKILMCCFALCGCAYIASGDSQNVFFKTSDSKRVKAVIQNDKIKKTYILPSRIEIPKSKSDLIVTTVNTECITPTKLVANSHMDTWAYGNILTFGLGFIKDADGAMWKYDDVYTVKVDRDNDCMNKAKALNAEILNQLTD